MNARQSIALVSLLAALSIPAAAGCGGPTYVVEQYAGPRRPAETIAILRFGGADDARLVVVDGERADINIAEDARLHVEILPGEHRVGVISRADPYGPLSQLSFRAEPGKVYRVIFEARVAKVYEVDSGSDAVLRDVTLPPRQDPELGPPPPPPPPAEELSPPPPAAPPPQSPVDADAGADAGADSG